MGYVKQKSFRYIQAYSRICRHIQAYSDISRHNHAYRGIIHAYSEPRVTLVYSGFCYIQNHGIFKNRGIFRILVYPKLCNIQNRDIFRILGYRTLGYSGLEVYSEHCQASAMVQLEKQLTAIIIFGSFNYFHNISFFGPLVHEINIIFLNSGLIFTPKVFIQCK